MEKGSEVRQADYPIDPIFLNRWSPRAMSGEEMSRDELMTLFEAARWAPSHSNSQPWRFVYALRGTEHWDKLFGLLVEFNQMWCKNAAALVLVVSQNSVEKEGKASELRTHSLDTGSAWMSIALQGMLNGLVVHGMGGFDYERARKLFRIPPEYSVEMMFAVGKPGNVSVLHERMQKSEKPNGRNPVSSFVLEGKFSL